LGMSGENLMLPDASTLLDTVTMAARAAILPEGVSTVTSRLPQAMRRLVTVDGDEEGLDLVFDRLVNRRGHTPDQP